MTGTHGTTRPARGPGPPARGTRLPRLHGHRTAARPSPGGRRGRRHLAPGDQRSAPGDLWPSARAGLARHPGSRNKAYGGTGMRVVIVYESMFGNTHLIADAIAKGLAPGHVVTVVPAA